MLTPSEIRLIEQHGISTFHDYWFNSLFAGEPYLEDGLLAYYDGRVVTLCGFPLRDDTSAKGSLSDRAQQWVRDRGAESVMFVGPEPVSLQALSNEGFRCVAQARRHKFAAELLIDCSENRGSIFERRVYRRAKMTDFQLTVRSGGMMSSEHFRLMEAFYRQRELTGYLAEIAFALPAVLRSNKVHLIEAIRDGSIIGFVAMHKPFVNTCVGLFLATNDEINGVSDFLYAAMLDQARYLGASFVNVGSSPSAGHYRFKVKWGGQPKVPPYYLVQWSRGNIARRFHTSWGPRLVRL
ncbi:MAG: hypothetical protein ACKVQW_09920 [Pyrinomonadaceae bacterium]